MAITGIFFGSDTGNTENIAKMIQKQLGKDVADVHDIAKSSKEDLEGYDILLLGIPTWYYGEAQCDWDDFFPTLEEIDFNGKLVALFGCGDQEDYAEYFCDALGTIRDRRAQASQPGRFFRRGKISQPELVHSDLFLLLHRKILLA
ncbi:Flavodoxin 1 [Salmonella enterica subsp. enterica serovar Urbana str. R8-2977]|uniref:Flavodoxin 1 n=1 Tax=Salmonella enterica subsp. enterica serovar Urbana str. R8-2977 TaxID=913084 RepID=G5RQA3_SALET|nr:Flavodoxin 1 [Salmonella enterica subsp. enterica serovar Urbana str. R8-2977]